MKEEKKENRLKSEEIEEFVSSWVHHTWHWYCSMHLPKGYNKSKAEKLILGWLADLLNNEEVDIYYKAVFDFGLNPDVHLVVIGSNKHGQTLLDIDTRKAEQLWVSITQQSSLVILFDNYREMFKSLAKFLLPAPLQNVKGNMTIN